ncbi:MAG: hypothetical protein HKP27_01235 [Myxococcales bacterium]|nr:hypothetical protein [Myxococcales bacterium]
MNHLDLSVFVEFGVGLAGFSGVVVAFTKGSGRLGGYDQFRVVQLLVTALTPAFMGLLLTVLASFGIEGELAWRAAGGVLGAALMANALLAVIHARALSETARRSLSPTIWRLGLGSLAVLLLWNLLNLAGWPEPISLGPIAATMAWLLVLSSIMFFRLLLARIDEDDRAR